jgi:hypothetical protein
MQRSTAKLKRCEGRRYKINLTYRQHRLPAFWGGFLVGLSSPVGIFLPLNVSHFCSLGTPERDWQAVGRDIRKALKWELYT